MIDLGFHREHGTMLILKTMGKIKQCRMYLKL